MPATRGIPLQGSTAKHDMAYPTKHASDIEDAAPIYHNPVGTSSGYAPVWDGSKYVSTDVLTPAEHTAIGDGAPHHAAVTLGNFASRILTLTTQALTTPVVNANKVYAGPTTGADAAPDWRALVAADMPALANHDHTGDAGDGGQLSDIPLLGAATSVTRTISVGPVTGANSSGLPLIIIGSEGSETTGAGGLVGIRGGKAASTGNGGQVSIYGGTGGATSGGGGYVTILGGTGDYGNGGGIAFGGGEGGINGGDALLYGGLGWGGHGGDVTIKPGTGAFGIGAVRLVDPDSSLAAILATSTIAAADKTFTFPNASGTFALTSDLHAALTLGANPGLSLSTQELVLGTPSTLTVATTNAVTGANHTHAITSSANPGAAARILATDASGYLTLDQVTSGNFVIPGAGGTIGQGAAARIVWNNWGSRIFIADAWVTVGSSQNPRGTLDVRQGNGANDRLFIGFWEKAALRLQSTRLLNYADGFIGRNLAGVAGSDNYVADTTDGGFGYQGIEFRHGGAIRVYAFSGATVADAVITPVVALAITGDQKIGVGGVTAPTAALHLPAGSASASTAPLKLTSGTLLTTAEAGAVEFLTDDYFATITTGAARKAFVLDDGTRLTDGVIPVAHTNGRLIDALGYSANPGAAASILATDASGYLTLDQVTSGNFVIPGAGGTIGQGAAARIVWNNWGSRIFIADAWVTVGSSQNPRGTLDVRQGNGANDRLFIGFGEKAALRLQSTRLLNYADGFIGRNLAGVAGSDNYVADTTDGGFGYQGIEFRHGGAIRVYAFSGATVADAVITPVVALAITGDQKIGVGGVTAPTAALHLPAGSASASTAPLKLTSGTLLTTAEAGAVEFLTDDYFATITTGAARKGIVLDDGARLTATRVPFATTNGRLTDDADLTFATDTLSATKVAASGGVTTQAVDFVASTPDTLAGDVNNWDLGNNTFIRASGGAADRIVTGIVARASGHLLIFQNIGATNKITFANESASSTAGNRLINANAGSTEITPNHCIMYIYDATTARWREITHL